MTDRTWESELADNRGHWPQHVLRWDLNEFSRLTALAAGLHSSSWCDQPGSIDDDVGRTECLGRSRVITVVGPTLNHTGMTAFIVNDNYLEQIEIILSAAFSKGHPEMRRRFPPELGMNPCKMEQQSRYLTVSLNQRC